MKKIIITIFLVLLLIINIPNNTKAEAITCGSLTNLHSNMIANGNQWLDMHIEEGTFTNDNDAGVIESRGGLCFGHIEQGPGSLHRVNVLDVDQYSDEELKILAWHIARSTLRDEKGYPTAVGGDNSKAAIRKWLRDKNGIYYTGNNQAGMQENDYTSSELEYRNTDTNIWGRYQINDQIYPSLDEYLKGGESAIEIEKVTKNDKIVEPTLELKKVNGQDFTFIGPYHVKIEGAGELKKSIIKYEGKESTEQMEFNHGSVNGKDVLELQNVANGNYQNFYFVIEGNHEGKEIKKIILKKAQKWIKAKIVIAIAVENAQHVGIFYGQWEDGEISESVKGPDDIKIKVKKVDEDTNKGLDKVRLVLKCETQGSDNKGKYLKKGDPVEWVKDITEATQFKNGQTIKGINQAGTYQFYEVKRQNSEYEFCRYRC